MDDNERDERDERDEAIVSARIEGASTRALARQFACTGREIEEAIDRRLNYELDNRQRLRLVKLSTERILSLMQPFYEKAVKERDTSAGMLCIKAEERLACLFGLDQNPTQRVDIYQVEAQQRPSDHEQIKATLKAFFDRMPPVQRALRERLNEIEPEEALRLLESAKTISRKAPTPTDGNGGSKPTEPTR
jgi:hypothetical protein